MFSGVTGSTDRLIAGCSGTEGADCGAWVAVASSAAGFWRTMVSGEQADIANSAMSRAESPILGIVRVIVLQIIECWLIVTVGPISVNQTLHKFGMICE